MPKLTILNNGKELHIKSDESILRQLVEARVPTRHNCRGRARCTTCRVRVIEGIENLNVRNEYEEFILGMKEVFEPDIRLACQSRASGDVTIEYVNEFPEGERPWDDDPDYQLPRWLAEEIGHPSMKEAAE